MKIKKGDTVLVIKGKDRGKTGKVEKAFPKDKKVIVAGLNIYKKQIRPTRRNPHGGIINFNAPIPLENLKIICPRCNKATRVGYKLTQKTKLRICKKCQESLDVAA